MGAYQLVLAAPVAAVRVSGGIVLAAAVVLLAVGALKFADRVGDPIAWGEQKLEAFKADDRSGQD